MLPDDAERRRVVWDRVLASGATLHGAVEDWAVRGAADVARAEDLWLVEAAMRRPADPALMLK
jgi:sporadic carbohydrate cluster protein (TIGR04323 family)